VNQIISSTCVLWRALGSTPCLAGRPCPQHTISGRNGPEWGYLSHSVSPLQGGIHGPGAVAGRTRCVWLAPAPCDARGVATGACCRQCDGDGVAMAADDDGGNDGGLSTGSVAAHLSHH